MKPTPEKIKAALAIVQALDEAIRELKQIPAGHLYARVMGVMSEQDFEAAIRTLCNAGLVHRSVLHLLTWIEPQSVIEYLCGCKYPTQGKSAYHDRHCAKCHRELCEA